MSNWVLHIVGETIDDDLAEPISKFVKEIQGLAHKVKQVRITTDTGEKIIHVTQDVGDAVEAIDPGATAGVDAVEGEIDKVVTEHETPAPVESTTPAADPSATPIAATPATGEPLSGGSAPVNPPQAGASSTGSNPSSTTGAPIPPAAPAPPQAIPTT